MIIKQNALELLIHQLKNLYIGEFTEEDKLLLKHAYDLSLKKLEYCFAHVNNKYYKLNGKPFFNPLHVGQWTMFLYTISHEMSKGNTDICDKIYGLSKMFSSADIFYGVDMPDIWFFDHPQGSVMGRASYSNFFTFSQGCTVGKKKRKIPNFW